MKFAVHINQLGIVSAGLHHKTDFSDWALLEYVADWQLHGRAVRMGDHVWISYQRLIDEMPMLGLNKKNSVANRVSKLVDLGLLTVCHDDCKRVFAKVTDFYMDVNRFRPGDDGFSVPPQERSVPGGEQGVPGGEQGVPGEERGVPVQEHSINNQNKLPRTNNQTKSKNHSVELPRKDSAVEEIFDHWREVMDHPKAQLDKKRRAAIRNALAWGYSLDVLKQAISGCAKTPHNMGFNERNQRYDGLELILRSADQIDRFVRNCHHPPALRNKQQQLEAGNTRVLSDWVPPELRHASE